MKGMNSREGKEEKRYLVHNRHSKMAHFWKRLKARKSRRKSNSINKNIVEGR